MINSPLSVQSSLVRAVQKSAVSCAQALTKMRKEHRSSPGAALAAVAHREGIPLMTRPCLMASLPAGSLCGVGRLLSWHALAARSW